MTTNDERNRVAQWAFDTRSILGRFHLWLEAVEERRVQGGSGSTFSFTGPGLDRGFIMVAAVTALGTRLFGRYGEGAGAAKSELNRVKKDADALSAYAMSEGLWYLTRGLPENHAVMVSLGEGLMPKAGETPEMGSNPLLGFGRIYARPQVARFLDPRVHRLINDPEYEWKDFWADVRGARITIWGAAIDTLENTTRFAQGAAEGPLTVLHLFDQPLEISKPYEGYMGTLVLPREVVDQAAERSTLITYRTPRGLVLEAIRRTYPGIEPGRVHVWTLGGKSREERIGGLWEEWRALGAHVVEEGWKLPGGAAAFTESGTYAPSCRVGTWSDDTGREHLFLVDGYAASAEAIQAASLDPVFGLHTCLSVFSSQFKGAYDREHRIMQLDPDAPGFAARFEEAAGRLCDADLRAHYARSIRNARQAGVPVDKHDCRIGDLFPNKRWEVLAVMGYMLPDPYSGNPGVEEIETGVYRVSCRAATRRGILDIALRLRLMEKPEQARLVFTPLLDRFYAGADYRTRAVKISDSGRIRNELQTLASEALEHFGRDGIRVHFDRIDDALMSEDKRRFIRAVLEWYKQNHPIWFRWLEIE